MDKTALFSLSYGVFFLSTKNGEKINACITNTAIQAASSPDRIAISCLNSNITCMMIKMSKVFSLSILDSTCTYELIERFGMHSARDTDKFAGLNLPTDKNGVPYLTEQTCAVLTCRVVDSIDLGSHTLFIAEIDDAFKVSKNPPLTYADYHAKVKPKPAVPASDKKIIGWKCKICGYYYEGEKLPEDFICPLCGHPASDFEPVYDV
ncbi:MAG: flavin reductase [Clostridia bacterium]|nr:flavin reductase [Clostridia bacterium]